MLSYGRRLKQPRPNMLRCVGPGGGDMTDTLSTNGRTRLQANRRDGQVWSALPGGCERSESDGASRPYLYPCFASPPTPVHPAPHSGSERRSPILNRRSRPGAQAASSSVVGSALLYAPERRHLGVA